MTDSATDILSRKGGDAVNISEFVGQTLTIVEFTSEKGQFSEFLRVTALNEAGEEVEFQTGAAAVVGKLKDLEAGGFLPIDVVVSSYESRFGPSKPGYDITAVE